MYEIILSREAAKTLERLNPQMMRRIIKELEKAKANPLRGKRLRGELEGLLSLRIGEMRAIYGVDSEQLLLIVHAIGPRGDIYKM